MIYIYIYIYGEKLRKKWAEKKAIQASMQGTDPQEKECFQMVAVNIEGEAKRKATDDDIGKVSKKRHQDDAPSKGYSRKRLREELQEQAKVARQKTTQTAGIAEDAKPRNKLRIKGNDAITRLLNVGRPHQEGLQDETERLVGKNPSMLTEGACDPSATVRVVAGSSVGGPSI